MFYYGTCLLQEHIVSNVRPLGWSSCVAKDFCWSLLELSDLSRQDVK